MGLTTAIEWCDSTANLEMGCDGCELWNGRDVKECYAGNLVTFHAGNPGWPESFDQPKLFPHRLQEILKWPDLTGKKRPDKPWLDGLPRIVFLDDLGDTFSKSLPKDWLAEHLEALGRSPHIIVLLTKQAKAMAEFSERHPFPANFWPGVSVTSQDFLWRVDHLLRVRGGGVRVVSAEPLHGPVEMPAEYFEEDFTGNLMGKGCERWPGVGWLIIGGSSKPVPCEIDWIRSLTRQGTKAGIATFVKQLGAKAVDRNDAGFEGDTRRSWPMDTELVELDRGYQGAPVRVLLEDRKGGDPEEWPEDLRVRQVPARRSAHAL